MLNDVEGEVGLKIRTHADKGGRGLKKTFADVLYG